MLHPFINPVKVAYFVDTHESVEVVLLNIMPFIDGSKGSNQLITVYDPAKSVIYTKTIKQLHVIKPDHITQKFLTEKSVFSNEIFNCLEQCLNYEKPFSSSECQSCMKPYPQKTFVKKAGDR